MFLLRAFIALGQQWFTFLMRNFAWRQHKPTLIHGTLVWDSIGLSIFCYMSFVSVLFRVRNRLICFCYTMVDCVSHFLVGIGVFFFVFCNIFEVDILDLVQDLNTHYVD